MPLFGGNTPNIGKLTKKRDIEGLVGALGYEDQKHATKTREVRRDAAKALGEIGDGRAVEPLITALEDEISQVVRAAAIALGKIGDARAVEFLIRTLKHHDFLARQDAAKTLGTMDDQRAVEPLSDTLKDEHPYVRDAAAMALKQLGYQVKRVRT